MAFTVTEVDNTLIIVTVTDSIGSIPVDAVVTVTGAGDSTVTGDTATITATVRSILGAINFTNTANSTHSGATVIATVTAEHSLDDATVTNSVEFTPFVTDATTVADFEEHSCYLSCENCCCYSPRLST